ncbi:hypothetical protein ACQKQD_31465 [Methylobacterium sp. NPDC080182]|uniref:hypothetical protein n=1 Tax=Methylobacterium sp. NPDC080182 TaxID=3390590 RepID=UPI003D03F8F6
MKVCLTVTSGFETGLRSLPPDRKKAAGRALLKFMEEPALPSLRLRAFEGRAGYYLINPNKGDRILLRKEADDLYVAVDVGPHDNVLRRWNR